MSIAMNTKRDAEQCATTSLRLINFYLHTHMQTEREWLNEGAEEQNIIVELNLLFIRCQEDVLLNMQTHTPC